MNEFEEQYYQMVKEGGTGNFLKPYTWENQGTQALRIAHQLNGLFDLQGKKILDLGCGKGFVVKALTSMGIDAYGVDISEYAIKNSEPEIKDKVKVCDARNLLETHPANSFDVIYTSATLEHIPLDQMSNVVLNMTVCSKEWIYLDVPIGLGLKNEPDNAVDKTHVTYMNPSWWIKLFLRYDFIVDISRSRAFDDVFFDDKGNGRVYHHVELVFRKERLKGDGRKLMNDDLVDLCKVFQVMNATDQKTIIESIEEKL